MLCVLLTAAPPASPPPAAGRSAAAPSAERVEALRTTIAKRKQWRARRRTSAAILAGRGAAREPIPFLGPSMSPTRDVDPSGAPLPPFPDFPPIGGWGPPAGPSGFAPGFGGWSPGMGLGASPAPFGFAITIPAGISTEPTLGV
jgi:hypothetical protein